MKRGFVSGMPLPQGIRGYETEPGGEMSGWRQAWQRIGAVGALEVAVFGLVAVLVLPTAQAAQAVTTFRVGIRIVPVAAEAGNTADIGRARARSAASLSQAAPASAPSRSLVVQPGETLTAIAARIYGDARRHVEIFALNRDVLTSPDVLPAGTRLRLP